jgi:hypothetical protein
MMPLKEPADENGGQRPMDDKQDQVNGEEHEGQDAH